MWIFARIWSLFASHYRWSERTNDWPKQCSWNSSWTRMNDQKWKGMMSVDDLIYLAESSSSKVWKDWFVCFIRISFFILSRSAKCVDLWEGEADRAIKKPLSAVSRCFSFHNRMEKYGIFLHGGGEGDRTPVQKQSPIQTSTAYLMSG